ncbi:MAG: amidohydrolase family protein [Clostridia bacterium]|nr:amidohydrolase family protein [Clostridia bacterium]
MKAIPKIDIHAHAILWPELTVPYNAAGKRKLTTAELFEQYYDKLNVEQCVVLPMFSPEGVSDTVPPQEAAMMAKSDPDRVFWFCSVDPRAGKNSPTADLGKILAHYKALGAKGVGELTSHLYADDPKMDNLFGHCEEQNLPVTIHVSPAIDGYGYGIVDDLGLPRLENILRKHPNLKILGHSQPFWSEIGDNVTEENRNKYVTGKVVPGRLISLLREYPNLLCDLSAGSGANALMRDRDFAARFIEEFADRLFYGCDICMSGSAFPFEFDAFLTSLRENGEISEENYYKLVRGNAEQLLGLV